MNVVKYIVEVGNDNKFITDIDISIKCRGVGEINEDGSASFRLDTVAATPAVNLINIRNYPKLITDCEKLGKEIFLKEIQTFKN